MERFQDDDDGYLRWIAAHPSGLVINCYPNPSADYLILHRARCASISVKQIDKERWTHDYIKVCADDRGEILIWCYSEVGGAPTACQMCDPLAPA